MTKKEQYFLKKICQDQLELASTVKELKISAPDDLSNIHGMMRRGLIHAVADIFELTIPLSDEVKNKLPLNKIIIKEFRNVATHAYGSITNVLAFACVKHCIDKEFIKIVKELSVCKINKNIPGGF